VPGRAWTLPNSPRTSYGTCLCTFPLALTAEVTVARLLVVHVVVPRGQFEHFEQKCQDRLSGEGNLPFVKALLNCITAGLIWQFILAMALVGREQRTLRWSVPREALWLRSPRSPRSGRVGGRVWLVLIPLIVAFAAEELISLPGPAGQDIASFLESDSGRSFSMGTRPGSASLPPCCSSTPFSARSSSFGGSSCPG
jgi:hypothetical protein